MLIRLLVILTVSTACACAAGTEMSFRNDVMPVFSKSGCNMGSCHGSANGKGSLKLSLRGESPETDFATLTQNLRSKRVNVDEPEASFLLRKPALDRAEHEGKQRFTKDSEEYRILRDWIAQGAKADGADAPRLTELRVEPPEAVIGEPSREVNLRVTALFNDGSERVVTDRAVYEPSNLLAEVSRDGRVTAKQSGLTTVSVRYQDRQTPARLLFVRNRPDYAWSGTPEHNFIDTHIFARLRQVKANPSGLCDDVTFVRRAYFDLIGLPPSREEAQSFVDSNDPAKRGQLIDRLLARPEFAANWALKWADLLRIDERVIDHTGTRAIVQWLTEALAEDRPMTAIAADLVSATGSTYENPPANYYRALREPTLRAEATAQVFLGTRLGCAKCHNHPFERWTQDDYYRFSALFDGIESEVLKNYRRDENDKMEFSGEQVVTVSDKTELKHPRTGKPPPRGLLGPESPALRPDKERLRQLADWMASADNPLFVKTQVNRIWAHLMGRGLVDPVDDLRLTNPPSHPELFDALASEFIRNGCRIKPLVRTICLSRTYQLSAEPNESNRAESESYARAIVRRVPAEPLLDAIHAALGTRPAFTAYPEAERAGQVTGVAMRGRGGATDDDLFLKTFGKPPRTTSCDCERTSESSLSQVFLLTSGPGTAKLLAGKNRLGELSTGDVPPDQALTEVFWRFLSRPPSEAERQKLLPLLESAGTRRSALEDIAWSLINAKEFLLRR